MCVFFVCAFWDPVYGSFLKNPYMTIGFSECPCCLAYGSNYAILTCKTFLLVINCLPLTIDSHDIETTFAFKNSGVDALFSDAVYARWLIINPKQ